MKWVYTKGRREHLPGRAIQQNQAVYVDETDPHIAEMIEAGRLHEVGDLPMRQDRFRRWMVVGP